MNLETMSKQRKMMLLASAVGVISMFLPWFSFIVSVNGMHGWGVLVFLCFIVAGILAYMGDQTTNLSQNNWVAALIAGGIAALIMVINFLTSMDVLRLLSYGFYGALIASIALVAVTYLYRSATDDLQAGLNNLRAGFNSRVNTNQTGGTTTTTTPTPTNVSHRPTDDPARPSA